MIKKDLKDQQKQSRKRMPARSARRKGNNAELLLQRQLELCGYEVRRTHLSRYPDIIAWNNEQLLLIEVKSRSNSTTALSNALSLFKSSAKTLTKVLNCANVLCYVRISNKWMAFESIDGVVTQVQPIVTEETYG